MPDNAPIREALKQDVKNVRELARLAHPGIIDKHLDYFGKIVSEEQPDRTDISFQRISDKAVIDGFPFLRSLRVIGLADQQARAFVYCVNPMDWIIEQGKRSKGGLSIEDRMKLSGAVVECNLIATLPKWRGRGYGARLLADAEDRYRAAGYRVMLVVVDEENADVASWYRDRGYAVGAPDEAAHIQLWSDRMHPTAYYDHITPGQFLGFKALVDTVKVSCLGGVVRVARLLDEELATVEA